MFRIALSYPKRKMHINIIAMICILGSMSGCAGLPQQASGDALPELPTHWSTSYDSGSVRNASLERWWLFFDDPLLAELIGQSLQSNTSVLMGLANLHAAQALREVAAASLMPWLDGIVSLQHSSGNNVEKTVHLDASWSPDLFGKNRYALDAASADVLASGAGLGEIRRAVASEMALDYIALRGSQLRLAITTANLATQQEILAIIQWRQQAGLASLLEVEQARADFHQTQALVPALQLSIEQTQHALAVLSGHMPTELSKRLSDPATIPSSTDHLALSIPVDTLRQRPDVRQAEYQLSAALSRYAQADAAILPNFSLAGTIGISSLGAAALNGGTSIFSSLLAGMSVPVFHGGALRAQVREQQAQVDLSRASYRAAVLKALREVEDALIAIRDDQRRLEFGQAAADAGLHAAALARQKFDSGLVDFQVVLTTQRTQLSAQDAVAIALTDISADHVRLYQALGGGWRQQAVGSRD